MHYLNKNSSIVSVYGSHNSAISIYKNGKFLVVEAERLINSKNIAFAQYKVIRQDNIRTFFQYALDYACSYMGIDNDFDVCLYQNSEVVINNDKIDLPATYVNAKKYIDCKHHFSHASGSFYQSNFDQALVFSFDGGGNDGFFNVYLADREHGVKELERLNVNLGFPYMIFGQFFKDIKKENSLSDGNLVYSGKIMGLEGYGENNRGWLPAFEEFYDCNMHNGNASSENYWLNKIKTLSEKTNLEFDMENRFEGQTEYDIAATSQKAFENVFFKYATPFFEKYPNLPIVLTGGCALNILLNTEVKNHFSGEREVYVAPNSSDCGLSAGMLLSYLKPEEPVDLTYAGIPLLDSNMFFSRVKYEEVSKVDLSLISKILSKGSIIGIARGRCEHGPRALGNRSIICDPSIENMKDILNEKVKHREWFRPFAPIVRLEDAREYFDFDQESRHMCFAVNVRGGWKEKLRSITHVDGTARIQTVTRKQNPFMYDLLTEFKKISGHGVLLNTSFNVNGKPILSSLSDAFTIFEEGGLDLLVVEDYMLLKEGKFPFKLLERGVKSYNL